MQAITIIAIGGRHDPALASAIETYQKRLSSKLPITWKLLPYSKNHDDVARREESTAILKAIAPEQFVILLDERGHQFTSEDFSHHLMSKIDVGFSMVFVIGGAYGVDETVRERANVTMSLSSLIFPHQLVRLILVEQLYRAVMIRDNHPYHHQ